MDVDYDLLEVWTLVRYVAIKKKRRDECDLLERLDMVGVASVRQYVRISPCAAHALIVRLLT